MTHTLMPTRTDFDTDVEALRDDDDVDYSGWYCIRTDAFPCPAPSCDFVASFMTAAHLIVVWPRQDDPKILAAAYNADLVGRKPKIVEYEPAFGTCIPYDAWSRMGGPVHGLKVEPDGFGDKAKSSL